MDNSSVVVEQNFKISDTQEIFKTGNTLTLPWQQEGPETLATGAQGAAAIVVMSFQPYKNMAHVHHLQRGKDSMRPVLGSTKSIAKVSASTMTRPMPKQPQQASKLSMNVSHHSTSPIMEQRTPAHTSPRQVNTSPSHSFRPTGGSDLFGIHMSSSPPSSHKKVPIPSRSSVSTSTSSSLAVGEMPLDLSRQSITSPAKNGSDSPLDLSGKGNSPQNYNKSPGSQRYEQGSGASIQKCTFCKASFDNVPFLKLHLVKCPRKPKSLTNMDIDNWIENNFPEFSISSGENVSRDKLPVVNGAVALGTICIKEEPEDSEDDIRIIDIEPITKSPDKSASKGSPKKATPGTLTKNVQIAPKHAHISYNCIYCEKSYDKRELLNEHLKTHNAKQQEKNKSPQKQNSMKPILSPSKQQIKPQSDGDKCNKNSKSSVTVHSSPLKQTPKKTPEAHVKNTDQSRSLTPTSSAEKKQAKRPVGNIKSIADNLLKRMTEKNQTEDKYEATSPTDSEPPDPETLFIDDTDKVERVEETSKKETPKKETQRKEAQKHEPQIKEPLTKEIPKKESPKRDVPKKDTPKKDTPKKDTPKKDTTKKDALKKETPKKETPKKETPKKETPKMETPKKETPKKEMLTKSKGKKEKILVDTRGECTQVISKEEKLKVPEKVTVEKGTQKTPQKVTKSAKKADEQQNFETKIDTDINKSKLLVEEEGEEIAKLPSKQDEKDKPEKIKATGKKNKEIVEVKTPVQRKTKEKEKDASKSNTVGYDVKHTTKDITPEKKIEQEIELDESKNITFSKKTTPVKSQGKKVSKGEKMTREKVADIAKIALDMGCLRRSPRAAKTCTEITDPSQRTTEEIMSPKTVKSGHVDSIQNSLEIEEKEFEPKKTKRKSRTAETVEKGTETEPTSISAQTTSTPKKGTKRLQEDTLSSEMPAKKKKSTKKTIEGEPVKETRSSSGTRGAKRRLEECLKETIGHDDKSQECNKPIKQISDEGKVKDATSNKISTTKTEMKKNLKVKKGILKEELNQAELEAAYELARLSETLPRITKEKKEKTVPKVRSKIEEVPIPQVAKVKGGKILKKSAKMKKKQTKKPVKRAANCPEKFTRIVGRKAYREWLENKMHMDDKSKEVAQKQISAKKDKLKAVKINKKKQVEEETDLDIESNEESSNDNDEDIDVGKCGEKTDPTWSETPSSPKNASINEELNLTCSKCKEPVRGRREFNKHILCHPASEKQNNVSAEVKIFTCPVCAQEFKNKNRCWGHMIRNHAGRKSSHECPYCFKQYSRKDAVQVHVAAAHPKERRRELAEKYGWQKKDEDEEEEFRDEDVDVDLTCKRCNRPIQSKGDCYTHIVLHSPRGKRKVCPFCDKTSKDCARAWEHVMVEHIGIDAFSCDQCSYRCAHEENLKKHVQTFHGKFLDPMARVKMDFESENWDLGIDPHFQSEPQTPLPLSSGNIISLVELSLNALVIAQRDKVQKLNKLLSGQNMDLSSVISQALRNTIGDIPGEESSDSTPKGATRSKQKHEENNNKEKDSDEGYEGNEEEGIYPDDPAVVAARAMIPKDCIDMELPCALCLMGITGAEQFKLHILKHICDNTRICPVCRRTFSRKSSCRRHLLEHTFKWKYKCHLCSQTFPSDKFLEKHLVKHAEQGYQCLNCLGKFDGEVSLWKHVNPDRNIKLKDTPLGPRDHVKFSCRRVHVCEKCHQEFRSAWGLQYHKENTHLEGGQPEEEKPYACPTCGKRFKSSMTLRNHQDIHVEDCSYLCLHCGLTCRTKRQLQKHIEYKHMEKIFKCSYCPKMFASRSRLKEHAIMHQNKTFMCDICGKVYRHQRVFETHCRQHFKPPVKKFRLFPCPECSHQSKSKEQLNLHIRRHTGERPYKCKECPKAFSSQTGLWRHQMSHAGRKPHECNLCKKTFVQKCSLDRHLLSHAGIKPYRCEYCGAEYSQSYPLTKHMEKKHPGMPFVVIKKDVEPVRLKPEGKASPESKKASVAAKAAEIASEAKKKDKNKNKNA